MKPLETTPRERVGDVEGPSLKAEEKASTGNLDKITGDHAKARGSREAGEKALDDPATDDAVVVDAERILEETPDAEIPLEIADLDEEGNPLTAQRKVRDVFNEADDEIVAAKEIEKCSMLDMGDNS